MDEKLSILVVGQESGDPLRFPSRLLQDRFRVATCPMESVALEFLSESRPAAVLMDADAFYLEGTAVVERLRAASPGTRVVFVDTDGPWTLLLEPESSGTGEVAINPCAVDELASAVGELLGGEKKEACDGRLAILAV
jgi:DNA-binding NtrC family response regulator